MTPPLISLCMIVKDEADQIEACLGSVHSVVDEIIVVDTGSTDGTQELCRKYGAKVIEAPWENSFSKARNIGLKEALGEWVLWLDADERLEEADQEALRQAAIASKSDVLFLKLLHYQGPKKETASLHLASRNAQIRLFRNKKGFQFARDIHEVLQWPETVPQDGAIPLIPVRLHHYGYIEEVVTKKNKARRNLKLLLEERENPDRDPWCDYHLASEFYRAQKWEHAFILVNQALEGFLGKNQLPPSLFYKLKYEILFRHGSMRGAWPGIECAIRLYPDYVDLHFYKGVFLMEHGLYAEAIQSFERCLEIGEEHWEHLSQQGMGSFHALHYLGRCMERLGKSKEAHVYDQTSANMVRTCAHTPSTKG